MPNLGFLKFSGRIEMEHVMFMIRPSNISPILIINPFQPNVLRSNGLMLNIGLIFDGRIIILFKNNAKFHWTLRFGLLLLYFA